MRLFCLSLLFILAISCTNTSPNRIYLVDYIPENTSVIIKSSNIEDLKSSIKNSDFIKTFSKTNAYKNLDSSLQNIKLLKPSGDLLICFKEQKKQLQYAIITKYHKDLFVSDSTTKYESEVFKFNKHNITKTAINNVKLYHTVIDSVFFASSSKELVEHVFTASMASPELIKIYNTTDNDKTLSILLKNENPFIKTILQNDTLGLKSLTNYLALDTEISQNSIYFNGITKANDSTSSLINIFKNTIPQENEMQQITPSNSDGFLSFTFNNYKTLQTNLNAFNHTDSLNLNSELFNNIFEVGVIYEDNNRAVVLNSIDLIGTDDALISEKMLIETFRETDIFSFSKPKTFKKHFSPLITFGNANSYCILDNYFVFSNSISMLKNIITNYQNKTTLQTKTYFQSINEQLSAASSLLFVAKPNMLNQIIQNNFSESLNLEFNNYNTSAVQFIYDKHFAHVNGIIEKGKARTVRNGITEELNIKLDSDIINNPQFVVNHITKEKEIVVQDIKNNLYIISNKGKVLWKKQLSGPILGRIEQIDMYKNGRLQLAFATPKHVYVLDRNGRDVKPFPMSFNDEITQPLAVFDYDKKKNYRLLVTQGTHVLMYDRNAKPVKGFKFKSAKTPIITTPQHFRIGSKDYICLKTKEHLYILNRTGHTRVKPKSSHSYSNQPVYLYNNSFTTTTADGKITSIDTKGNIANQNLNLSANHNITTSSKTLVAQSENKLFIKNNTIDIDYGNYTRPGFFYIYDKIYISITDLQSHKVYLYDSNAKLLPNFPVYGNSEIILDNVDNNRNLEFVTKGESNSILLYRIN
ncbi:RNA polymerase beta'' subunit family protein [Gaetbulibacter saemankumensis]|uniref:hypothetical protein n=1 Tax=Gaetbulibacter saemankumensis TaxID=311208 RepID=UPI000402CE08|nr:hypothetical protein [Gaetbulibacter saemankumensis]